MTLLFALTCIVLGLVVSVRPAAGDDGGPVSDVPVVEDPVVVEAPAPVVAPSPLPEPDPALVVAPVPEPVPAPVPAPEPEPAPAARATDDAVPAQLSEPVAPITDYANYPNNIPGIFEPTCNVDGHGIVTGLLFSDADETATHFRDLHLVNDEQVTMKWTGFAPGCENTMISLSTKRADSPTFDPKENQELDVGSWVFCGTVQHPCVAVNGVYSLTVTMPPANRACSWQVDGTIGPPLSVIGPSGTFYSPDVRTPEGKPFPAPGGKEMLLRTPGGGHDEAANNGGRPLDQCAGRLPAQLEKECAAGGLQFELSNTGDIESEFDVEVDGSPFAHIPVAPQESEIVDIPAAEDSTHHVKITAETGKIPPVITTLLDQDVTRNCEEVPPPPPTVNLSAAPDCDGDAPFLSYTATAENASPSTVTLHWFDASNVERLTLSDVPLTGRVPYPGVVLGSDGKPTDWPGWVTGADGRWVEGADGFEWVKPTITLTASFNPTSDPVTVTFPVGNPDCHPKNPPVVESREGLPRTGAESATFTELGIGLVGLGSLVLLASRRQRRPRPAWRHLAR